MHLEKSIHRAKACAGVAVKKGSGAEGWLWRAVNAGGAENIRSAVAFCGELSYVSVERVRKKVAVSRLFFTLYGFG